MATNAKDALARELSKPDEQINLAAAALLISEHLNQAPDRVSPYLTLLDDMAGMLRPTLAAALTIEAKVNALLHYLFEELYFQGNNEDYYTPHNSFLDQVLERRTGIPISLSVVCLEVGWRLGLPMAGLGLPGHFIVGCSLPDKPIYIDPFNRGAILSEDDCLALSHVPLTERQAFRSQFLVPAAKKAILFRMLLNLKQIYLQGEKWELAHRTVDLMLIVQPDQADELKDRGLIAYRLNHLREAAFDLQRYLFLTPTAPDARWLEQHLEMIETKLSRLN